MKTLKNYLLVVAKRTLTSKHCRRILRGHTITIKTKKRFSLVVRKSNLNGWNFFTVTARDRCLKLLFQIEVQPSFFGLPVYV